MKHVFAALSLLALTACQTTLEADYLIRNGNVFVGDNTPAQSLTIALKDDRIVYVGAPDKPMKVKGAKVINAEGLYVLPGFIDPHTHSIYDLKSEVSEKRQNKNYQYQGVTTVMNGNDGFGDPDIAGQSKALTTSGIGTNTTFFIGHGALRKQVMGGEKRAPTTKELEAMKGLVATAMEDGALGLSTGLFYAPGSFSDTDEVIELAKVAAQYGGVYDSHMRDESTYNIGLLGAVDEVLTIARKADVPVNIAHIKALGVDVWGQSEEVIAKVEAAHAEGLKVTADQYPWQASGTRISNALIPRWVRAGEESDFLARLNAPELIEKITEETAENLRKRGGPESILITKAKSKWENKTLGQVAKEANQDPVDMALHIARNGDARIASFNMNPDDIKNFMVQDWVMTSSDGSTGHPRKYASYPKKYQTYVQEEGLMPVETFFYRSSGLVADTFNICERGYLREGYFADIAILHPDEFKPVADFKNAEELSEGVVHLIVNGEFVVENHDSKPELPGRIVKRCGR